MDEPDASILVSSFNDCINAQDIEGLSRWMTDDHVFIDKAGSAVSGKSACLRAWRSFFAAFPDYRNTFDRMQASGDAVIIAGSSSCSDPRLAGRALWTARIHGMRISEWRVFEDTRGNRERLGVAA